MLGAIFGNYRVESQLGVLYRVLIEPVPLALVPNGTALRGK